MTEDQIKSTLQSFAKMRLEVEEPFTMLKVLLTLPMEEIEQVMSVCDTLIAMVNKAESIFDEESTN